jgi:hypothetical protein
MHILTRQTVGSAKAAGALAQCSFLALQSRGVAFPCCELGQEMLDQRRHRGVLLGRLNARSSIGFVTVMFFIFPH